MTASTAVIARNGDLAVAGPLGSLDAYFDRVSRIPVLTREEERELAERFRLRSDLELPRASSCCRTCASWCTSPAATPATACPSAT